MNGVEHELEQLSAVILAAERWADEYSKTPDIHAKLIKTNARLERKLRGFFKDLASQSSRLVNWGAYHVAINAYNVDVIVNDTPLQSAAKDFMSVTLNEITFATALGAQAGQEIYNVPLGITTADSVIQDTALGQVARLVGKIVSKDGQIIDNPKAGMNILETVRQDIRSSIATSIGLGEDISQASDRIAGIIDNPTRAETIAQTETVNSFGQGLDEFGKQSGAVGHEWQDVGAVDVCADNSALGPIPFEDSFEASDGSEIRGPTAHPRCRCSKRLIYQNELDNNPDLFG